MSEYIEDKMLDETKEKSKLRVKFNNSVIYPEREKSRTRVMIIALATVCCVVLIPLCTWLLFPVNINNLPEWQQENFMIEAVPGLRYRPKPPDIRAKGTLIDFDSTYPSNYSIWINIIDDFVKEYKNPDIIPRNGGNTTVCDYNNNPGDKICYVDLGHWYPCTSQNHYGYDRSTPCVFLRFNKILNWIPDYYNNTDNLPEDMPRILKEHIQSLKNNTLALNNVWVSCKGENPADIEFVGPIEYIPQPGFPGYFFPFTNKKGYLSPLVAVWFLRPRNAVVINIECRLWAPNIEFNREKGRGFVHFELMID